MYLVYRLLLKIKLIITIRFGDSISPSPEIKNAAKRYSEVLIYKTALNPRAALPVGTNCLQLRKIIALWCENHNKNFLCGEKGIVFSVTADGTYVTSVL
jgi:hypothetical protein